ncbi:MAG TPA: hypothetical protein DEP53_11905, partial [Bacteroidetes bacterium]|nr:hypothetical protein [Bacteroidota bacterium]
MQDSKVPTTKQATPSQTKSESIARSVASGHDVNNDNSGNLWWKKRFRPGEFLIEKSIAAMAFLSFAFITLIFIFVFREALPIFSSTPQKTTVEGTQSVQETYGDESSTSEMQKQVDERKKSV